MVFCHWAQAVSAGGRPMAGVASHSGVKRMVLELGDQLKWMVASFSGTMWSSRSHHLGSYSPPSPFRLPSYLLISHSRNENQKQVTKTTI